MTWHDEIERASFKNLSIVNDIYFNKITISETVVDNMSMLSYN